MPNPHVLSRAVLEVLINGHNESVKEPRLKRNAKAMKKAQGVDQNCKLPVLETLDKLCFSEATAKSDLSLAYDARRRAGLRPKSLYPAPAGNYPILRLSEFTH